MFCARDHMGVKPFYYYLSDDLFLFASEIKAINGILPFEPKINELAIAKSLAEATSNLDSENEKNILKAIDDLHGEITILIIAHRLSTIKNVDYIYLIDKGQILESGTWDELLKNQRGYFWNICESQGICDNPLKKLGLGI